MASCTAGKGRLPGYDRDDSLCCIRSREVAQVGLNTGVCGKDRTPLFVDGLHATTLKPARWQCWGETWILSNVASQQPLLRILDGLTVLTGEMKYRTAAEAATRCALKRLRAPNGLLYWGGHMAWDLLGERLVGPRVRASAHK